ncbi:MAG: phenylalanine--tRNA ligase subunit beta [Legionellales bacterium]|nr:phenylalanine--tRNA ligase subunit beta [Legionellales bacterium]|tara:strand:- start:9048 stop:11426 length:2379 start_codon:yes stop_codon:yes gene_type:complete
MKLSELWLREWANPAIDSDTLVARLTMAGLEVDSVDTVAQHFNGIVVGEVVEVSQHPDADKLRVCKVNVGEAEPLSIVCGAANVAKGMRVPVATVGAVIGDDFKIKKAKLRGVESFGMICSTSELGLTETSDGIMGLPQDAPIGEDIRTYLQLDDSSIDVDLTPNRGDCLSVQGVARDVAVMNRCDFTPLAIASVKATHDDTFPVNIIAKEDCPHYVGRVIKNIDIHRPSPLWLTERLRRSGLRSIDPVVDVTNYVLLELGQPMHAFDLDTLKDGITVRKAREGESLVLLDGENITLTDDVLVIADDDGPLAMAGIMGGENSGVTSNSKNIFLESAFFAPQLLAGKARRFGLHTDSSHRFERGVDPALQVQAIERATALLLDIVGGEAGPIIEVREPSLYPARNIIELRRERLQAVLGITIPDADVLDILQRCQFEPTETKDGWQVTAPSFRFDIEREEDLIEEVIRIYGYDNVPAATVFDELTAKHTSERQLPLDRFKQCLNDRDYSEVITYSFVDHKLQQRMTPGDKPVHLLNPISADMSVMRTSLWPGLLQAAVYNLNRQQSRLRFFESGLCFSQPAEDIEQEQRLAGIAVGTMAEKQWGVGQRALDFYDVKGDVEALFSLGHESATVEFSAGEHPALHPGQTAKIFRDNKEIGLIGRLHPQIAQQWGINGAVFLFELSFQGLRHAELPNFATLSKYPAISRDIAVVVDESTHAAAVMENINNSAGELLTNLQLFDVYQGEGIDPGHKSLALGLTWQADSRTLVDDEVNQLMEKVINSLKNNFGAVLRD